MIEQSAFDVQEGGDHYASRAIQPIQYIFANGIGFAEGNVVKYVTRWRDKGGIEDLNKARHYLDMLIEHESGDAVTTEPKPDDHGWIEFHATEDSVCPVDGDVRVAIVLRLDTDKNTSNIGPASHYLWREYGISTITHYRVVE